MRPLLLLFAAAIAPSFAQTFTTLVNFNGPNGSSPQYGSLVKGTDGNLYGVTMSGGNQGGGTVFKLTPAGALTSLYQFSTTLPASGVGPCGGLVQGIDSSFYGTTMHGGASALGSVYRIIPSGPLTTLYSFGTFEDGSNPCSTLIQANDGNFYGTDTAAGEFGGGALFKVTNTGKLTTLYNFDAGSGTGPAGALIQASDGNLYGTTYMGGRSQSGTVFKITTSGALTTIYTFTGGADGASPIGALIQASDGNLYGTTSAGGIQGNGTVFKLTTSGALTTLYSFRGTDGANPNAGVIAGSDGNFYGTTKAGGAKLMGTVFQLTASGTLTTLHSFSGSPDGAAPLAGLVQIGSTFFGSTSSGGSSGDGTVFSVSVASISNVPPPSINPGGIAPAGATGQTIQAGEWVTIFGENLAQAPMSWKGDFPTTLGGTSVAINGKAAYLSYVSPTQINLQAPDDSTIGPVAVAVTTAGGTATSGAILASASPVFLLLDTTHVNGIILTPDGSGAYGGGQYNILGPTGNSLGFPTEAAKAGDTIELFAIGLGATSPPVPAGQAYLGAAPTVNPVTIQIGNLTLTPSFAGLSAAGLYQIDVKLPSSLPSGDVPLYALLSGVQTQYNVVISLK